MKFMTEAFTIKWERLIDFPFSAANGGKEIWYEQIGFWNSFGPIKLLTWVRYCSSKLDRKKFKKRNLQPSFRLFFQKNTISIYGLFFIAFTQHIIEILSAVII